MINHVLSLGELSSVLFLWRCWLLLWLSFCGVDLLPWWSQCLTIILSHMTWILVCALCEQCWGCEHSVNILPHKCVMDLIRTNTGLFKPPLEPWHAFWAGFFPHVTNVSELLFVLLQFFGVALHIILFTGCFLYLLLTILKHWAEKQRHSKIP